MWLSWLLCVKRKHWYLQVGCWSQWVHLDTCSMMSGRTGVYIEKIGSLWLYVPSDMKNGIIRNDHMIQQQRITDTSYSGFCWPKRRVGDTSWHITRAASITDAHVCTITLCLELFEHQAQKFEGTTGQSFYLEGGGWMYMDLFTNHSKPIVLRTTQTRLWLTIQVVN